MRLVREVHNAREKPNKRERNTEWCFVFGSHTALGDDSKEGDRRVLNVTRGVEWGWASSGLLKLIARPRKIGEAVAFSEAFPKALPAWAP